MNKKYIFKFVLLVILALAITFVVSKFPSINSLEEQSFDARMVTNPPVTNRDKNIVMVWLDEATMRTLPYRSPVPRDFLANVIQKITEANPKMIALDIFFESPSFAEADEKLINVLKNSTAPIFEVVPKRLKNMCNNLPEDLDGCVQTPDPKFDEVLSGIGLADLPYNPFDSTVRKAKIDFKTDLGDTPTLASLLYNKITGNNPKDLINIEKSIGPFGFVRKDKNDEFYIRFMGKPSSIGTKDSTFPTFQALLVEKGIIPKRLFENKIVIIGAAYGDAIDSYLTPYFSKKFDYKRMNGVEIHANVLSQLLTDQFFAIPTPELTWLIILLLVTIVLISTNKLSAIKSFIIVIVIATSWLIFSFYVFANLSLIIPIILPITSLLLTYSIGIAYKALTEGKQKRWIKGVFAKYVPPAVVEQMTKNPAMLKLGGEQRIVTSFFSDIASFTTISEKLDPKTLVQFLNEYLTKMNDVIFKYNGTIDKYEGDAVIAFFNAPLDVTNHEECAVRAGLEVKNIGIEISKIWREKCGRDIVTRVGLNTGPAVVGNMGSEGRFDYTAISDTINLASRLEGTNKFYNTTLMISEFTAKNLPQSLILRPIDKVKVKGKNEAVILFEPIGENINSDLMNFINKYKNAWDAFYSRNLTDAEKIIHELKTINQNDGPLIELEKRLIKAKSDASWNLITELTSK